ncbi:MAG: bifunctional 3-phosphoshikimate 1-carboxyvinyltransferase/cytidylate kinase [Inhella sp.]|jgi:3-phosphoshikimate 1-carboxyvinyltransferase|uniref:bifunctional 3-phosphoshikimate 1-carboxyvinyltransferase/cytidylate kinase n=1 Tax=Inhella sp. TaxID=1921806 RepID=UPI0022BC3AF5|nr:bifunctional 3-phosphoshikimate 1-carboxyvinyltransferase/cytidylate kinase [Inhella sp.]MCZ8235532.1 bifunctional 3-phosphoshikimate 1-carboxyvinyltransferase/cytidylate kinase [Inhella sp.]
MYTIPFLDLPPLRAALGSVTLPGSKSISNRILLMAALAEGRTEIHGLLDADDTQVMLAALRSLGVAWQRDGSVVSVQGMAGRVPQPQAELFLGNAGTAMRPLAAALALLAARDGGDYQLRGVARMHERPIGDLVDALRGFGCRVECLAQEGYPPLRLHGPSSLRLDQPVRVRGDVSSQFLTALLMALPLVATRDIVIEVEGELISKPYIDITLALLARFGVVVRREGWQRFTLPAGCRLRAPGVVHVEGDASAASYFIGLGSLAAQGEPLRIDGVGRDALQGDVRFADAAAAMGADIRLEPNALLVQRGRWPLRGIEWDCIAIPDAAMTLAVMALYADSPTLLTGIGSWRVKETDRIAAMATELRKLGAQVDEGDTWLRVHPLRDWRAASIHTYDDHRMAMCFSLAALNPLIASAPVPVRIQDPACVAKTYPEYFETFFGLVQADAADVPVVCVDGPTASGKGTLADEVARALGFWVLDSGALYRAAALAAQRTGIDWQDEAAVAALAATLPLRFLGGRVLLDGDDITDALRDEAIGLGASTVAALPSVRQALHALQLGFRRAPGLVADGRDMGTAIFPDAALKVFLTATAEQRAERRHKQLISKGIPTTMAGLLADLQARDARDKTRSASPLKPAEDAKRLDNSDLSIEASVQQVLAWWAETRPFTGKD